MITFSNVPDIWHDCNRCLSIEKCETPFPPSGLCPHLGHLIRPSPHSFRRAQLWEFYIPLLEQSVEVASVFARWQVRQPTDDADFLTIRNYHLASYPSAQVLICELTAFRLETLQKDCLRYYKKPIAEVKAALLQAIPSSISDLDKQAVTACSKRGGHWTIAFMDAMKVKMRGFLGESYLKLDQSNEAQFRAVFEQEWRELQNYLGFRYDFRVVPRLSYGDMARYQLLPHGDSTIRRAVSTYLVHQCFFYPHFSTGWFPELLQKALWPLVRRAYNPLTEATVARAARNLQLDRNENRAKDDLRAQVEQVFDESASQFDFHFHAPKGFQGRGVLGLNEDKAAGAEIDKISAMFGFSERTTDINATPFAHYIKEKLDRWVEKHCSAHRDFDSSNTNVITGADGQRYLTIRGAGQNFGVSVDHLRYLDRINALKPVRARDVAPTEPTLAPDIRLYPDDEQTRRDIEIADARAKTRSLALSGKELTRKQAAVLLQVNYNSLRDMENRGLITPIEKGQTVVYNEAVLIQAQILVDQKKEKKAKNGVRDQFTLNFHNVLPRFVFSTPSRENTWFG